VPRSPNTRVLPPSTEPGLWSADRPRAALEYQLPSVLGFDPPSLRQDEAAATPYADICAQVVGDTARFLSVERALSRVSNAEVTCIGAHAYLSCLVTLYTNATKDADVKDLTLALYRYQKRLDPEMEKVCKGVDRRRSDLAALLRSVETAWKNSLQTWREGR
jgi:hypothetical protein